MLRHPRSGALAVIAVLLVAVASAGCGIKGPLEPAPKPAPEAAKDSVKAPTATSVLSR